MFSAESFSLKSTKSESHFIESNNGTPKCIGKAVAPKNELLQKQLVLYEKPSLKEYIPKKATQQEEFLKQFPEYDGRGLLIAVIDSGVELSMPGLQNSTTGLPKIIDCFDFTGVGNVDTSYVAQACSNGTITGLSGRELKIPSRWKNPSGIWHLGSKSYEDLLYGMNKEQLNDDEIVFTIVESDGISIETIGTSLSKNIVIDCIAWFDGQKWLACADTSFSKDLENVKVLTNYRDEHEYAFIAGKRSFCVTIDNDGNSLELYFARHVHATLVAQAAAAYFPQDDPHKNGLAPGAQIVSLVCLGHPDESRNINNYINAFKKCIELKVDIINVSVSITDEVSEIIKEVTDHGIIVVSSAGNDGSLNSSIHRQYVNDQMFVIGSVLTPEIKSAIYEMKENTESLTLPRYSARGITNENQNGVDFTVEGTAIFSFPKWCLNSIEMCGGTSFSCPVFAGSLACLLSALKANSFKYSPPMLKLALSNTAHLPEEDNKIGYGNGIIQISSAFEYFKKFKENLRSLHIPTFLCKNKKGIFWVQKRGDSFSKNFEVTAATDENNNSENICWILQSSPNCDIFHSDRVINGKFTATVDTTLLKPGEIYFTEIHGINSSNSFLGPLFKFPVTVIVPETSNILVYLQSASGPDTKNRNYDPDSGSRFSYIYLQSASGPDTKNRNYDPDSGSRFSYIFKQL